MRPLRHNPRGGINLEWRIRPSSAGSLKKSKTYWPIDGSVRLLICACSASKPVIWVTGAAVSGLRNNRNILISSAALEVVRRTVGADGSGRDEHNNCSNNSAATPPTIANDVNDASGHTYRSNSSAAT